MPQMSPLNWLILFLYFSIIFIMFNSVNYFILNYTNHHKNLIKSFKNLNWKW